MAKTASSAVKLLIDIGYFPVHINLDLLKLGIPTDHSDEIISAAQSLLLDSSDPDEVGFICLTTLLKYEVNYICFHGWIFYDGILSYIELRFRNLLTLLLLLSLLLLLIPIL